MIEELECALGALDAYWWLTLEEGEIKPASYPQTFANYVFSFFTDAHQRALKERFVDVLREVDHTTAKAQIMLEKMKKLQGRSFWETPTELPDLPLLVLVKEEVQPFPHQIEPYFENGRFHNYPGEPIWTQFIETLRLLFVGAADAVTHLEDLSETYRISAPVTPRNFTNDPLITWIGHACVLIQVAGMNLLFDPSFGFVSPCFIRHVEPGIPREELPLIDVLFLSHNHADHANQVETFAPYAPVVFAGKGSEGWLHGNGFERVETCGWWQSVKLTRDGQEIRITVVPAQHGSQTGLLDMNKMLWCGYVIEVGGVTLYFSGDTALGHELVDKDLQPQKLFEQVRNQFGLIDIAFLPIAPQNELTVHIDEEQALEAMRELDAKMLIPIHWGAYRTGKEQIEGPIKALIEKAGDLEDRIQVLKMGEPFTYAVNADEKMA
ncbi:MBL fold metallo-hydrolase [Simkania negevensis]|uniref:Putative lipoprotein n=1 Tax=Simkania negevensis (strain ATCC VR-1471 / DSM 27360 / Z) TaxID=331113 RepID=F8L3S2_SIMNZ|nr:MBL fold metallo-hydrolase [Simkania negevensis]CCB89940.1 putative lipoprotein [Simkania negevensis Z]